MLENNYHIINEIIINIYRNYNLRIRILTGKMTQLFEPRLVTQAFLISELLEFTYNFYHNLVKPFSKKLKKSQLSYGI